jgi:hypothetical protein
MELHKCLVEKDSKWVGSSRTQSNHQLVWQPNWYQVGRKSNTPYNNEAYRITSSLHSWEVGQIDVAHIPSKEREAFIWESHSEEHILNLWKEWLDYITSKNYIKYLLKRTMNN